MNGLKYLLDTNIILGILSLSPDALALLRSKNAMTSQCAFSAVTRMELLGFPSITQSEEMLIHSSLSRFTYLAISSDVEDAAIQLRRTRKLKLPDAIIAATALCHDLSLLTLDRALLSALADFDGK